MSHAQETQSVLLAVRAAAADPHATDLLTRADAVAASQSPPPWVPEGRGVPTV